MQICIERQTHTHTNSLFNQPLKLSNTRIHARHNVDRSIEDREHIAICMQLLEELHDCNTAYVVRPSI